MTSGTALHTAIDETLTQLGALVRARRKEQGFSLKTLAGRSGLSVRFLTDLEAGRANISVARLDALARSLGTRAGRLLGEAEDVSGCSLPRVVALVGLRGAGKSTVGRRLARRLQVRFFELDALIEEAAGLSLGEIFALHGEAYYRQLETEALRTFLDTNRQGILATGGGLVTNREALRLLEEHTVTVWLQARPEDHWTRVVKQGDPRPMAGRPGAKAELYHLLAARAPLYARARHRVDTSRLTVAECVKVLAAQLERAPGAEAPAPLRAASDAERR